MGYIPSVRPICLLAFLASADGLKCLLKYRLVSDAIKRPSLGL